MVAAPLGFLLGLLVADDPQPHPHPILVPHRRGDQQHRRQRRPSCHRRRAHRADPPRPAARTARPAPEPRRCARAARPSARPPARLQPSAPAAPEPRRWPLRSRARPATPRRTRRLPAPHPARRCRSRSAARRAQQARHSLKLFRAGSMRPDRPLPSRVGSMSEAVRRSDTLAGMSRSGDMQSDDRGRRPRSRSGAKREARATQFPRRGTGSPPSPFRDSEKRLGPVAVFLAPARARRCPPRTPRGAARRRPAAL